MIQDLILSIDTEFDGDIPGINSLWSIGAALMEIEKIKDTYVSKVVSEFEVHLHDLPGMISHPVTMDFWEKHQEAWKYARENAIDPKTAIIQCDAWLQKIPRKYIHVTWPASADVAYIEYYFQRFLQKRPFKGFPLDLRSYTFAMQHGIDWAHCGMNTLPEGWKPDNPTPHRALADAIAQGHLACRLVMENFKMNSK